MNRADRDSWTNEVLDEVLLAVIASQPLREALIFKGARILNLHIRENRQSLDIDSNAASELVRSITDLDDQMAFFKNQFSIALRRYFEGQNPVRFELEDIKVERNPSEGHPHGWDAFWLRFTLRDNHLARTRGLPRLEIEVAAPETLGPKAVETMNIRGCSAQVYSLHRIAGEKLRAYLTSLPAYRQKMGGVQREFRIKDLHDIARILRVRSATDTGFWINASHEFRLACKSRFVDCEDLHTFMQGWSLARERYKADPTLRNVPFAETEQALTTVAGLFKNQGIFPLNFPVDKPLQ